MRRTPIPFAVVAALISPMSSASTVIDEDVLAYSEEFASDAMAADELAYDPLASEYVRRKAEIESELADDSDAQWAGQYQFGDGLTYKVTLVIAPDHGFAALWTGCVGVSGRSFGSVTQQGGRLLLHHEMPNTPGIPGDGGGIGVPSPTSHNINDPRYSNCTLCHSEIHGSNKDRFFR